MYRELVGVGCNGSIFWSRYLGETSSIEYALGTCTETKLENDVKILLTEQDLQAGIERLAKQLSLDYGERPLTIIAIMTGSLVLLADLIRRLEMPLRVSLIQASSYRGGTESGDLSVIDSTMLDIEGRDCLLVDDIFDTGKTLTRVTERLQEMGPKSIRSVVLLHKQGRQLYPLQPDYHVFKIPDEFVVGYGLDYQDLYRNLPYVGVMEQADLDAHHIAHSDA